MSLTTEQLKSVFESVDADRIIQKSNRITGRMLVEIILELREQLVKASEAWPVLEEPEHEIPVQS